ncbi:MAG: exodeoxyribonuclease V subunit alpha, partial [Gammaproteobacteria bacterium]|nr:exodeoxyribonuclease V subunit alpha [Gammaproteobacteria bacterium]
MNTSLYSLMAQGVLPPISYYFSRFVSKKQNVDENSLLAQTAALLSSRNMQGDICIDLKAYANRPMFDVRADMGINSPHAPDFDTWVAELNQYSWLGQPGTVSPFILEQQYLYLGKYWNYEQQVLNALSARLELLDTVDYDILKQGLGRLFVDNSAGTINWQKLAAAIALTRRFTVISGGPGTGKTTTVTKVLALMLEQNIDMSIALVAPTGKAAARLSDSIRNARYNINVSDEIQSQLPVEAMTIHRFLGMGGGSLRSGRFKHHAGNPVIVDCIVIDEASMIDLPLMAHLLEALPVTTRIILLGDRDQLASVEAGNVLGDITGHGQTIQYNQSQTELLLQLGCIDKKVVNSISSGLPPMISNAIAELKHSYRFDDNSGIGQLAAFVNSGEGKAAQELFHSNTFADIHWL